MFFLVLIAFLLNFSSEAQTLSSVTVKFGIDRQQVQAVERKGLAYISVQDFAKKFRVGYYYSSANKKSELKFESAVIKFTAKNPYIIITGTSDKKSTAWQLALSTLFYRENIFVDISSFQKYINKAQNKILVFDNLAPVDVKTETTPDISTSSLDVKLHYTEKSNGSVLKIGFNGSYTSFKHSIKTGIITIQCEPLMADVVPYSRKIGDGIIDSIATSTSKNAVAIKIYTGTAFDAYDLIKNNNKSITVSFRKKAAGIVPDNSGKKDKWKFDVVVIDAGHGGKDHGAIGVNKTVEKDINLSVALKLGNLINKKLPGIKVVYTRTTDNFVELHKRGKIANEASGKLFISIHCNSVPGKTRSANGTEVYLLRPGKTKDAIDIAERENSVISYEEEPEKYKSLTDENFILVSMAHASYMKYSEKFAELLDINFRNKLEINSRGIKQAGFYVLVGASMPGVLIETGYVTNERDAAYIKSQKGQNDLAEAILDAVKAFRDYYEKAMKEN